VIILILYFILRDSLFYAILRITLLTQTSLFTFSISQKEKIVNIVKRRTIMPEKKLADRLREAIRLRGYSIRTEKAYLHWYERFVRFHKLCHHGRTRD